MLCPHCVIGPVFGLQEYIKRNPIPTTGSWDAISGEEFLRQLLTGGLETATWKGGVQDPLFSHVGTLGVDPRALGQRIMDIRTALATEFIQVRVQLKVNIAAQERLCVMLIGAVPGCAEGTTVSSPGAKRGSCVQDLQAVAEENAILMRECAMASLSSAPPPPEGADEGPLPTLHPEMLEESPRSIPDTAKDFIFYANETPMERFERERDHRLAEHVPEAEEGGGAGAQSDEPRPGALPWVCIPGSVNLTLRQVRQTDMV